MWLPIFVRRDSIRGRPAISMPVPERVLITSTRLYPPRLTDFTAPMAFMHTADRSASPINPPAAPITGWMFSSNLRLPVVVSHLLHHRRLQHPVSQPGYGRLPLPRQQLWVTTDNHLTLDSGSDLPRMALSKASVSGKEPVITVHISARSGPTPAPNWRK